MQEDAFRIICCLCGTYHQGETVCQVLGVRYRRYYRTGSNRNPYVCDTCLDRLIVAKEIQDSYSSDGPVLTS